jgi:hypothetical protein
MIPFWRHANAIRSMETGDEPMTDAKRSYLETLAREIGGEFDARLSKADASKRIDELRE